MSTQSQAQAVEHLEEARSSIDGLAELRQRPHQSQQVAAFYDSINQNMKLAEIEALLYLGDRLDVLICTISEGRLTAEEIHQLLRSAQVA